MTTRGCSSMLPNELVISSNFCFESGCNNEIYPANRRVCYQCTSSDINCIDEPTSYPCTIFTPYDLCYTSFDEITVTRGCSSDFPQDFSVCSGEAYCRICDSDDCNVDIDEKFRSNSGTQSLSAPVNTCVVIAIWIFMFVSTHTFE